MIGLFNRKKTSRYGELSSSHAPEIRNATQVNVSDMFSFGATESAGVSVSESTAMQVSAVYACVALIGGAIAAMPLPVYQRTKDGREKVDHDIWWLLNEQPHPDYTAGVFWEAMLGALLLHGDAFAVINAGNIKTAQSIEWIHPRRVTVKKDKGQLIYTISQDQGSPKAYQANQILHIPGPGFNGLRGMSQISYVLKTSAGIALAADRYSANFFENGARPDFAVELAGNPTVEQQEMMRKSWTDRYQGINRAHTPALLTNGAKVHELTLNAEDSQLLTTRAFQVEDIARIFGVPPHMIGHAQSNMSVSASIEHMGIGFVKYTLARHLTKIEQELNRKLWPIREKYFIKFNTSGLERGDYKTRNEGYRIGLGRAGEPGWMTVNEIRRYEDMAPMNGGDQLNTGMNQNESTAQAAGAEPA